MPSWNETLPVVVVQSSADRAPLAGGPRRRRERRARTFFGRRRPVELHSGAPTPRGPGATPLERARSRRGSRARRTRRRTWRRGRTFFTASCWSATSQGFPVCAPTAAADLSRGDARRDRATWGCCRRTTPRCPAGVPPPSGTMLKLSTQKSKAAPWLPSWKDTLPEGVAQPAGVNGELDVLRGRSTRRASTDCPRGVRVAGAALHRDRHRAARVRVERDGVGGSVDVLDPVVLEGDVPRVARVGGRRPRRALPL